MDNEQCKMRMLRFRLAMPSEDYFFKGLWPVL
jgi:hypothetical protein